MQTTYTQRVVSRPGAGASPLRRLSSRLATSEVSRTIAVGAAAFALGSLINAAVRPKKHRKPFKARLASATLGRTLGGLATGAIALGASATGALAIGVLGIGKLRIKELDVERFRVGSFVDGSAVPLRPGT